MVGGGNMNGGGMNGGIPTGIPGKGHWGKKKKKKRLQSLLTYSETKSYLPWRQSLLLACGRLYVFN